MISEPSAIEIDGITKMEVSDCQEIKINRIKITEVEIAKIES